MDTVTLVCTAGHIVTWPRGLFPRPDTCPNDIDSTTKKTERCNAKMHKGIFVPDVLERTDG